MNDDDIWEAEEKKEKEESTDFLIELCKTLYEEEENPLHLWRAIQILKDDGRPYPDWVKNYLNQAAEELLKIDVPKKDAPSLIKNALEIYSGRDFTNYHHLWKKYHAYDRVLEEREKRRHSEKGSIYDDVGKEFNVSGETIKKWCSDIKKWKDEIIENG